MAKCLAISHPAMRFFIAHGRNYGRKAMLLHGNMDCLMQGALDQFQP